MDFAEFWLKRVKPATVISGMALGWDQALAQAALNLDIPYYAYIPFNGQESKWPVNSQDVYRFLLNKADHIVECSEPGYAVWKMQHRNECMVKDADVVLALWNGSSGGTANCVDYAEKVKKQVVNLWPVYQMIATVNSEAITNG